MAAQEKERQISRGPLSFIGGSFTIWAKSILVILAVTALVIWAIFSLGCLINFFQSKESCALISISNMISTGGVILTWGAALFDLTLQRGVLNAGYWLRADGGFGIAIASVWIIIRDVVNLALIGSLVWASISMILNTGQQIGKIIVQVIIVAILVNFSYFFAGFILDVSHFVSRIIYEEAFGVTVGTPGAREENQEGLTITSRFMQATHLGSLNDIDHLGIGDGRFNANEFDDYGVLMLMGFVALIVLLAAAWVFFSVAALFTQRFIVIVILLITAPVGMLAFTGIPRAKDYGQAWWAALWSQAIFPPVLLVLLAASFKVLEQASAELVAADASFLGLFVGPDGTEAISGVGAGSISQGPWGASWELITVYIIGLGLMYASMQIATNIAKQEPLKVPTTGQIYGQYRKAFKPIMQVPKAVGAVGKIPVPFLRDKNGRPYQNLGALLTFAPDRAGRPAAPWDQVGARANAQFNLRQDNFDKAQDRFVRAGKALEEAQALDKDDPNKEARVAEAEAELEASKRGLGVAWNTLPENQQNFNRERTQKPTDEQAADGITKKDLDESINVAEVESANAPRYIDVAPVPKPTPAPKASNNDIISAIDANDRREAARDKMAYMLDRREYKTMLADQALSGEFVRTLRNLGHASSLPSETAAEPNIAANLNLTEVTTYAGDTEGMTDEQFVRMMNGVSDSVHDAYRAHPVSKLRPERPARAPKTETPGNEAPPGQINL